MNRPSLFTRIAGWLPMTFALLGLYGFGLYEWHTGRLGWFSIIVLVCFTMGTIRAAVDLSRYKRWEASWNAMNGTEKPTPRSKRGRRIAWAVAFVLIGVPVLVGSHTVHRSSSALMGLWLLTALAVAAVGLFRVGRGFWRGRAARRQAKALAATTSWLVKRPRFAPSRRAALRRVPDYARRLLRS